MTDPDHEVASFLDEVRTIPMGEWDKVLARIQEAHVSTTRHAPAARNAFRAIAELIVVERELDLLWLEAEKAQEGEKARFDARIDDLQEQVELLQRQVRKHAVPMPIGDEISMLSSDNRVLYFVTREFESGSDTDTVMVINRYYIDTKQMPGRQGGYTWVRTRLPGEPKDASEDAW